MREQNQDFMRQLKELIDNKDSAGLHEAVKDLHPADVADLVEELDTDEAVFFIQHVDSEIAADILVELDDEQRKDVLDRLPNEDIADLVEELDTDDAVDVIQELDKDDQEEVINQIEDMEQAGDIVDLMQYDEDTAGGYMTTDMIVVNEHLSMPECIQAMREQAEEMDEIHNIYVVDDDNRLKGIFPLKTTITNPSASKIKHVMEPDPLSVRTDTPIEDVALDFEKYDLVAVPVVDSIGRLVGAITVDDIIDLVRESSERDYQLASGISADVETDAGVWAQVKARIPWLFIGLVGGIANAMILDGGDSAESALLQVLPGMALFIPLIGGTGGNVGTQSSAIVVQGLANGSLTLNHAARHLLKELGVAMINALTISALLFAYVWLFPVDGNPEKARVTAMAVTISLFAVILFASLFGSLVPIVLERLKLDPAVATGPFVTVTNDIVGMIIYMNVSTWLIRAFTTIAL